ncbi:MAG: DUF327 family protein [Spirochaetia bacterium]|nr:DUF327 family protein [Spirochaetia bacterium]
MFGASRPVNLKFRKDEQYNKSRRKVDHNNSKEGIFQRMMTSHVESIHSVEKNTENKNIEEMLTKLEEYEEKLINTPDIANFQRYKNYIKKVADFALEQGFTLKSFKDRTNKKYEFITVVDSKLQEILINITRRNKDVSIMLHIMGQIRGLILDVAV